MVTHPSSGSYLSSCKMDEYHHTDQSQKVQKDLRAYSRVFRTADEIPTLMNKSNDHAKTLASSNDLLRLSFEPGPGGKKVGRPRDQYEISRALLREGFTHLVNEKGHEVRIDAQRPKAFRQLLNHVFLQARTRLILPDMSREALVIGESLANKALRFRDRHKLKFAWHYEDNPNDDGYVGEGLALGASQELEREISRCVPPKHRAWPLFGIGGGKTLHQMVQNCPKSSSFTREFGVFPLNYVTRTPSARMVDSPYLAVHLHWQLKRCSHHKVINMPPLPEARSPSDFQHALLGHSRQVELNPGILRIFNEVIGRSTEQMADIAFIGTSHFHAESSALNYVFKDTGITYDWLDNQTPKPVGDTNFNYFDAMGRDITRDVLLAHLDSCKIKAPRSLKDGSFFGGHEYCHPFLLAYNMKYFCDMVSAGKSVVLVAGGGGAKVEAILALIRGNVANGLITDDGTMARLLDLDDPNFGSEP